jgi:hypothetical protein
MGRCIQRKEASDDLLRCDVRSLSSGINLARGNLPAYLSAEVHGAPPNGDIPEPALGDYNEAAQILDASPRGAAALLRLALEKLLECVGMAGKKLDDRIASAVAAGVPLRVQQAADTLRVTGNNAVHPGQIDLKDDRSTATKLFGLVNIVTEKLITEPREVAALFDGLPDGARAAIKKRDGKDSAE